MHKLSRIKVIVSIAFLVFMTLITVLTSCSTDKCRGVSCQNGATKCIGGVCQCPTGYTGNFCELSSITFKNDGYTTIYIDVAGSNEKIMPDSSISFAGQPGLSATMYAYTFGTNATNQPVGDSVIWSNNYVFPSNGALSIIPLDVYPQYFCLQMIDSNPSESITSVYVNYGITGVQTEDNITIPNDKKPHLVGYYLSYPLTQIYAVSNTGNHWLITPPAIPDTVFNELVTVSVN